MKIYLFDPETHIYQGEDFADDKPMRPGHPEVFSDATTIPPPSCGRGEVPLFVVAENRWRVVSTAAALAGPDGAVPAPGPDTASSLTEVVPVGQSSGTGHSSISKSGE